MRFLLLVTLLCALPACRSASVQYVPLPDLRVEVSRPELARVYLLRPGPGLGAQWAVDAYSGLEPIGRLTAGGYLCFERAPGPRVARLVTAKQTSDGLGAKERVLEARLEAGRAVFARVSIDRETWRPLVELLDAEEGRALLERLSPPRVELAPAPE